MPTHTFVVTVLVVCVIWLAPVLSGVAPAYGEDAAGWPDATIAEQEVGATLGLAGGGGVSPGGLFVSGQYLYRITTRDWFEGGVGFVFGGSGAKCFRDRANERVCDHGFADGFSAELSTGLRHFMKPRNDFHPYLRGGVALRMVNFKDDEVRGLSLPLSVGAGVRKRVAKDIAVVAGANVAFGIGWFDRDLGVRAVARMLITAGVEFGLR